MSVARAVPLVLAAFATMVAGCAGPVKVEAEWQAFGLDAHAEVWALPGEADEILASLSDATRRAEAELDAGRPDSELSRLNLIAPNGYHALTGHRDVYRAIRVALDYARASDGAYDPAGGGWRKVVLEREALAVRFLDPDVVIELSGIAPGYALDIAARNFARQGAEAGLLRLGGHAYAWRAPPGSEAWVVAMADPRDPARELMRVTVASRGVAVAYRGDVGAVDSDVVLALAVADSAADADVVSTALVHSGSRASGTFLKKTRRVEAVLLVDTVQGPAILASSSLRDTLALGESLEREIPGGIRWLLPPATL